MSIIYATKSGAKICLAIEMNIKLIFILTISLFVQIVSNFVFPAHIRLANAVDFLFPMYAIYCICCRRSTAAERCRV